MEIVISTGNILTKTVNFGKETATQECFETIQAAIQQNQLTDSNAASAAGGGGGAVTSNDNTIIEINTKDDVLSPSNGASEEEREPREELKVSFKIFLYSIKETDIVPIIQRALNKTGTSYVDSVVLSFADRELSCDSLKSTWNILERQVESGVVKMVGLSDVETEQFKQMYQKASVKPSVVQINLASCCVVPVPLQEFCKLHNIQLLTHSDPVDILPVDKLEELNTLLKADAGVGVGVGDVQPGLSFGVKCVLRYQVHSKCRGVICNKGYIASFAAA